MTIADLRRDYRARQLSESEVAADPIAQFRRWFDEALRAELLEVNAMTLATASPDGRPAARIVLLKGLDDGGFVFFTNYGSAKATDLEANPQACLVCFWAELERQVRITGTVARVDASESDAYFASRPRESQLGALASPQSQVIASRATLESRLSEVAAQHTEHEIARPAHWGGYRVSPSIVEFWQGRPNRLHDRLRYRRVDGAWIVERLAP